MGTRFNNLILAALLVVVFSAAALAQAPRLINYQGRVLNAVGAPVLDGAHNFDFEIYDMSAGGAVLWQEPGVAINTTGGLFTYQLGSPSSFNYDLFTSNLELWLEVTVDGQVQTPRTRLISNPYAETAGNLSLENPFSPGQLSYKTDPSFGGFITYGGDGLEQIRLWGYNWGEIFLHDGDASNDRTVVLTANLSGGGELDLRDDAGVSTINLHGGQTGNSSVEFPTGAIYDDEILDEPGVANQVRSTIGFSLSAVTFYAVDSVDITIPTSGYVELTGGCYLNLWHNNGTTTEFWVGISKSKASFNFVSTPGVQVASVPSVAATTVYQMPCTSTRLFSESAGTHRYYLLVRRSSGTNNGANVAMIYLRAKFYSTAYGSIVLSKSDNGSDESRLSAIPTDGSQQYENLNLRVQTLEEINAKLEAERETLRAENERLRFEKEQLSETQQRISSAAPNQNQK